MKWAFLALFYALPLSVYGDGGPSLGATALLVGGSNAIDWETSREASMRGLSEFNPTNRPLGNTGTRLLATAVQVGAVQLAKKKHPAFAWGLVAGIVAVELYAAGHNATR